MRTFKTLVSKTFPGGATAGEVLAQVSKLPATVLQSAAEKGAVWVQRGKGKILRERNLAVRLAPQDTITLYYDPRVLAFPAVTNLQPLFENEHYSVWHKPAGVVPQGTQTGDHASLLRFVELHRKKEVFLVHRLDRETEGLMVVGHTPAAAAKLSDLFQKNQINKEYEAIVLGELQVGSSGTIDVALDDKKAVSHFEVLDSKEGKSHLRVRIDTGRLHQIRRHLDHIGHPIMGDPKYGKGNKNKDGLKLLAKSLTFIDPWDKKSRTWSTQASLSL